LRIALVSPIDASAIDALADRHDVVRAIGLAGGELEQRIADREVLIARSGVSVSAGLLRHAPSVRLVIRAGSGLDNLDVEYMRDTGIRLVRIPGPGARTLSCQIARPSSRSPTKADS
jgi:D-3-phosphoglycerate dehydrogenase / 2-oxoglutarate reductase